MAWPLGKENPVAEVSGSLNSGRLRWNSDFRMASSTSPPSTAHASSPACSRCPWMIRRATRAKVAAAITCVLPSCVIASEIVVSAAVVW